MAWPCDVGPGTAGALDFVCQPLGEANVAAWPGGRRKRKGEHSIKAEGPWQSLTGPAKERTIWDEALAGVEESVNAYRRMEAEPFVPPSLLRELLHEQEQLARAQPGFHEVPRNVLALSNEGEPIFFASGNNCQNVRALTPTKKESYTIEASSLFRSSICFFTGVRFELK